MFMSEAGPFLEAVGTVLFASDAAVDAGENHAI